MNVRASNSNGTSNEKRLVVAEREDSERVVPLVEDYAAGRVSGQVLRIVMSYVGYVNRTMWSKSG